MNVVYSKRNCNFCTAAKKLLDKHDVTYEEYRIGTDITKDEFLERYPNQKTVPFIILESEVVGGYKELRELFKV